MIVLIGVETLVSVDFVLWKHYLEKLENFEVDHHDTLTPLHRTECLVGFPTPLAYMQEGSSTTGGNRILDVLSISMVTPPFPTEIVEDNNDDIISSVR